MEIIYNLTDAEVQKVTISFRFICDRSKHMESIKLKDGRYVHPLSDRSRKDIYWVNLILDDIDLGSLSIDPINETEYRINQNWCNVHKGLNQLKERINKIFYASEEYQKQCEIQKRKIEKMLIDKKIGFTEPLPLKDAEKLFASFGYKLN